MRLRERQRKRSRTSPSGATKRMTHTLGWKIPPGRGALTGTTDRSRYAYAARNAGGTLIWPACVKTVIRSAKRRTDSSTAIGFAAIRPSSDSTSNRAKATGVISSATRSRVKVVPTARSNE